MAVAVALILLLFLLRPGASRLKSRIIAALSAGVGRPVDIGSVHIRLLPQPGFDLENLVVYDDPAFGAEPMLRASEVTADLRLTSLIRGRMEISRLDLTEPSLNLTHSASGPWNLESLLQRTAHLPTAPTAKGKLEPRPAFPYIEGTAGRINFKSGAEKKSYALTNADFSLWQDSENAWGMRLKAQPFRTDMNLNDTGMLQVSGTWQRADSLPDTPLQFQVEWNRAQLGQLTKFFSGNDRGWRGSAQVDVTLSGSPAKLQISTDATVDDFRRYDITSGKALRLAAHCDAEYSSLTHEFHEMKCNAPVSDGMITLTGEMGLPVGHRYAVAVTAETVPADAAVILLERAKKNLPDDLSAEGTVSGKFSLQRDGTGDQFEGRGEIDDFRLSSAENKGEMGPETVPFVLMGASTSGARRPLSRAGGMRFPEEAHIELGPVAMRGGKNAHPTMQGWIARSGYDFAVTGETEIPRALRLARMIGIAALPATPEGSAQVDLQVAGSWGGGNHSGFAGPQVTGSVKLQNVQVAVRGAENPAEIASAEMRLLPDEIHVTKLNAKAAGSEWTGSLEMPRGCGTADACEVHFALNTNQTALIRLNEWLNVSAKKRPWYRVLEASAPGGPSLLARLRASGRVTADRLQLPGATATHLSANVSLQNGKLQLADLTAEFAGGKHKGEWQVDFNSKPAVCEGSGTLTGVALDNFANAMNDGWIAGTANGSYKVTANCAADFWESAKGTLRVSMKDGAFPHVLIGDDAQALRVSRLDGQAELHAGTIEIKDAKLDSPEGQYQLSGTASLNREVDFKLKGTPDNSTSGYTITGTLAAPKVSPLRGTEQARLKPTSGK
ncbi:MAG: AsmA family protein [Candidatus Sulfotelmatobacter sp.]